MLLLWFLWRSFIFIEYQKLPTKYAKLLANERCYWIAFGPSGNGWNWRIFNNKIKLLCSVGLTGHYLIYQGKTSCIIIGFNPLLSNAYSIITFIRIPSRSEHLIFMQLWQNFKTLGNVFAHLWKATMLLFLWLLLLGSSSFPAGTHALKKKAATQRSLHSKKRRKIKNKQLQQRQVK